MTTPPGGSRRTTGDVPEHNHDSRYAGRNHTHDPYADVHAAALTQAQGIYTEAVDGHRNRAVNAGAGLIAMGMVTTHNEMARPLTLDEQTSANVRQTLGMPEPNQQGTPPQGTVPPPTAPPQSRPQHHGGTGLIDFLIIGVCTLAGILLGWLLGDQIVDAVRGSHPHGDTGFVYSGLFELIVILVVVVIVGWLLFRLGEFVADRYDEHHEQRENQRALPAGARWVQRPDGQWILVAPQPQPAQPQHYPEPPQQ